MRLLILLSLLISSITLNQVIPISPDIKLIELYRVEIEDGISINGLAFSSSNQSLAIMLGESTIRDNKVVFLDIENKAQIAQIQIDSQATAIAYSSDGSLFVIGTSLGVVKIYDTSHYNEIQDFKVGGDVINSLAISEDNKLLAVTFGNPMQGAERESIFTLIELETGDEIISYPHEPDLYGAGVAFDPKTANVFFAVNDVLNGEKSIWEIINYKEPTKIISEPALSFTYNLLAESGNIFSIIGKQVIKLVFDSESETYTPDLDFDVFEGDITGFALHPSLSFMAIAYRIRTLTPEGIPTSNGSGAICLYDFGQQMTCLDIPESAITTLAFSPDGTLLASGGADGTVRLWGIPAGE